MRLANAADFLDMGLRQAKYYNWNDWLATSALTKFKQHYGVTPQTCADAWLNMYQSHDPDTTITLRDNPMHLLLGIRFLFTYDTEADLSSFFDIRSHQKVRETCRVYIRKLHLLLRPMIGTLADHDVGLIFLMTIDGTHCRIQEPRPFSTAHSSHKFGGKPAVNYELGIALYADKLIWCYGPTLPGSDPDLNVYRMALKHEMQKLPDRRIIADGGYPDEEDVISLKNDLDPREIAQFKDRALARGEKYNGLLKKFNILCVEFRHGRENHQVAFEACCTLTQLEIDNGSVGLFDAYP